MEKLVEGDELDVEISKQEEKFFGLSGNFENVVHSRLIFIAVFSFDLVLRGLFLSDLPFEFDIFFIFSDFSLRFLWLIG